VIWQVCSPGGAGVDSTVSVTPTRWLQTREPYRAEVSETVLEVTVLNLGSFPLR
jgi:hypothetical protein